MKNASEWRDFEEKYVRMARLWRKIRQSGAILMKNVSEWRDFDEKSAEWRDFDEKYIRVARFS